MQVVKDTITGNNVVNITSNTIKDFAKNALSSSQKITLADIRRNK